MWMKCNQILLQLIALLLILFPALLYGQEISYLKVETDSAGIAILCDGQMLGATPLPVLSLPAGTHQIVALNPKRFLWGNPDWSRQLNFAPAETLIITPKFQTQVFIRTEPFGADVYINDIWQGTTPLIMLLDEINEQQFMVKKDGYETQSLQFDPGRSNQVKLHLAKKSANAERNDSKAIQRTAQVRYRRLTYGLWGMAILTGLAAVHFKDRADEKYQRYLQAGSLKDMNRYFNDTRRLDRYSNISLGAVQGCFVLSFYFLIKSVK